MRKKPKNGWGISGVVRPGNVLSALDELGIRVHNIKDGEAWAYCPGHFSRLGRQERRPDKWSVNIETGQHSCFSCDFSGSFVFLIQEVLNVDRRTAEEWVRSRGGTERFRRYLSASSDRELPEPRRAWNESRLALFGDPPRGRLEHRRISSGSVKHYGVLWDRENDNWILPVRDPDTYEFWGYQEKSEDGYFNNKPAGISKGETLFGIDCFGERTAVLLESPLDCLRLYTAGILGGVASYGAKVTAAQMNLLFDRAEVIVLALDNDDAGRSAIMSLRNRYISSGRTIKVFNYQGIEAKDIGEESVTDLQILQGIRTATSLSLTRL